MIVSLQCEAPGHVSVQLVNTIPLTMVYGTYNYSYWGESKPTYNWGAPHCIDICIYTKLVPVVINWYTIPSKYNYDHHNPLLT